MRRQLLPGGEGPGREARRCRLSEASDFCSAASRTVFAAGAATAPPEPLRTNSAATAIFGLPAGANEVNQASVLFGSDGAVSPSAVRVSSSSAVPVLPATFTPGMAAAVPVPKPTTPIISSSIVEAILGEITRSRLGALAGSSVGARRTPSFATVCATDAI